MDVIGKASDISVKLYVAGTKIDTLTDVLIIYILPRICYKRVPNMTINKHFTWCVNEYWCQYLVKCRRVKTIPPNITIWSLVALMTGSLRKNHQQQCLDLSFA
jgi:hypothetical protein